MPSGASSVVTDWFASNIPHVPVLDGNMVSFFVANLVHANGQRY
jgi:hypothetical protein